jgi:hypothetical protein
MTLGDIMTLENGTDDELVMALALQRMINSGMWSMPGSTGRAMMGAISEGDCLLGREAFKDYYGNVIPSRDDVMAGTKGSYDFVVKHRGKAWADILAKA